MGEYHPACATEHTDVTPKIRQDILQMDCPLCHQRSDAIRGAGPVHLVCPGCGFRFTVDLHEPDASDDNQSPADDSPTELAELDRWLAGEPIQLQRTSDWERLRCWYWNRPLVSVALATTALTILVAAIVGMTGYITTSSRLEESNRQRQLAEASAREASAVAVERLKLVQQEQHRADEELAAQRAAEQNCQLAEQRCRYAEENLAKIQGELAMAERQARVAIARHWADNSKQLLDRRADESMFLAGVALDTELREGMRPSTATEQVLRDAMAQVAPQGLPGHRDTVRATRFTSDGRWLVTVGEDRTARLWDFSSDPPATSPIVLRGYGAPITSVAISADDQWLAIGDQESTTTLWNLAGVDPTQSPIVLNGRCGPIHAIAFTPDGRGVITGGGKPGEDNAARLWNLTAVNPAADPVILRGHDQPIRTAAVTVDNHWVITGGDDGTIRLWNLQARYPAAEQIVLRGHEGRVSAMAVGPGSRQLVTAGYDGTIRVWDLQSRDPNAHPVVLTGHHGWIATVAVSPDGRRLVSGGFDSTARLWNLSSEDPRVEPVVLTGHTDCVGSVAFSRDGRWVATGSLDRTARLWDLQTADMPSIVLRGHTGPIRTLAISPDSRWLVTGAAVSEMMQPERMPPAVAPDSTVRLWDLQLESALNTARVAAAQRLTPLRREQLLLQSDQPGESLR
ncbi:MAG TPA: hypothetical protein VE890_02270 [Thermoguttaceae bacterium]|nr:hypothetical protein [Thermoguttaceae bacterium]